MGVPGQRLGDALAGVGGGGKHGPVVGDVPGDAEAVGVRGGQSGDGAPPADRDVAAARVESFAGDGAVGSDIEGPGELGAGQVRKWLGVGLAGEPERCLLWLGAGAGAE